MWADSSAQLTRDVPELVVEGEWSNASVDASVGLGGNYQSEQLSTHNPSRGNTTLWRLQLGSEQCSITYVSTVNIWKYMHRISAIVLYWTTGR